MAFSHRRLFDDSYQTSIPDSCESPCDQSANLERVCPDFCARFCPKVCRYVVYEIPKSSPPFINKPSGGDDHPAAKSQKLHFSLTVSFSVIATVFLLFCCYMIYKLFSSWNAWRMRSETETRARDEELREDFLDEDHGPVLDHPIWYIRTVGLDPSIIRAIAVCNYKRGEGLVEGTECSICLSEFEEDETLRLLPKCSHAFHVACIDTWLSSHTNCPVCRAGIVSNAAAVPASTLPEDADVADVDSVQVEVISEDWVENRTETEGDASEIRIDVEEEGRLEGGADEFKIGDDFQPMRRSVSMDSLSASVISGEVTAAAAHLRRQSCGNSDGRSVGRGNESNRMSASKRIVAGSQSLLRLVGSSSSSIRRSLPREDTTNLRRSVSCSGSKVLQSR